MSKILRMRLEGGVPEEINVPLINDNKDAGSALGKITFSVANKEYNGYHNSTAAEKDKSPIKLSGKSYYSDVYKIKIVNL